MSTFGGKMQEIPEISVDEFTGENFNSFIYFLSHCHSDHMRGLSDWGFQHSLINRSDVFLYASSVSVRILKNMHPILEPKLKELTFTSSTLIKVPYRDDKTITVTMLPAGHCPGSVMFLFETDKTILYTGDYRVKADDLKKYNAFYSLGHLKKIDKIYLDTTFFKLSYLKLPSRDESIECVCTYINEWIKQSDKHLIKIILPATYGFEYLFTEVAKRTGMPVHVSSKVYLSYRYFPEMDKTVTTTPKTQIHAGCGKSLKFICRDAGYFVRTITPTTVWWEGNNFKKGISTLTKTNEYRVCYSSHASLEEIKDFLLFLKPAEIEPCVVPEEEEKKQAMQALIRKVTEVYKDEPARPLHKKIKLFNENICRIVSRQQTPDREEDKELNDLLNSPPRNT